MISWAQVGDSVVVETAQGPTLLHVLSVETEDGPLAPGHGASIVPMGDAPLRVSPSATSWLTALHWLLAALHWLLAGCAGCWLHWLLHCTGCWLHWLHLTGCCQLGLESLFINALLCVQVVCDFAASPEDEPKDRKPTHAHLIVQTGVPVAQVLAQHAWAALLISGVCRWLVRCVLR